MGISSSKQSPAKPLEEKTPSNKATRFLHIDPRSPASNFVRTPIAVSDTPTTVKDAQATKANTPLVGEEKVKKTVIIKPSKLSNITNVENLTKQEQDPRSPSSSVPRTPIEPAQPVENLKEEQLEVEQDSVIILADENIPPSKKAYETSKKERNSVSQPKDRIQNQQCRNLEEEFSRNEVNILQSKESAIQTS